VGGGGGSFAVLVLVLGLLCTCAVICKKRRVKGRSGWLQSIVVLKLVSPESVLLLYLHTNFIFHAWVKYPLLEAEYLNAMA
jgi:hypothetical protein